MSRTHPPYAPEYRRQMVGNQKRENKSVKRTLAALTAATCIAATTAQAGPLAPRPELIASYDRAFIERSGAQTFGEMLDTGILRYFFTGGRNLLVTVNGRPFADTGQNLDDLPLSAIERIEVIRAESLGTTGGGAAVRGAFNLVLRKDLEGFDLRGVTRIPTRDGGSARQGSAMWGGAIGKGGHLTVGVDILDREEIHGSSREHSRSEWESGGYFADTKNVSIGGNTALIYDRSERRLRSVFLGECDPKDGYTGPLRNPAGVRNGDFGCGYPYGNDWWDSPSYDQRNAIANFEHTIGEQARIRADANVTQGHGMFRYAPSVDVFSIQPSQELLDEINEKAGDADPAFTVGPEDYISIGHRFIGHGNRDWRTDYDKYDFSATVNGLFRQGLGYEAKVNFGKVDGEVRGDTFVDKNIIREEIAAGRYNVADPLSDDPAHREAIARSSVSEEEDFGSKAMGASFALEGDAPGMGSRSSSWTAGLFAREYEARSLLQFRGDDGSVRDVNQVLGSGGTSYEGERTATGLFGEFELPLWNVVDVRAGGRLDSTDDVGDLEAWRLGAKYSPNDILTARASWTTAESAPSMLALHATGLQDHPYVRCIPDQGPPPRECERSNWRQVTRNTTGNPDLDPSNSERLSFGAGAIQGPSYFIVDWYRLTSKDLPGRRSGTWAMLNRPECPPGVRRDCIERAAGDITIHDSAANIVDTEVTGMNIRFGTARKLGWGSLGMRGFWRYVTKSEVTVAGETDPNPLPRNAVRIVSSVGRGPFTGYWALNYRDKIENRWGDGHFRSWTGHDLTVDWTEPLGIEKTRLTAGIYNVTDTKLSTNTGHAGASDGPRAGGWGRTMFLTLNTRF